MSTPEIVVISLLMFPVDNCFIPLGQPNSDPVPLQVCDLSGGPTQRPCGTLAERGSRLQLAGWIPVREWTISCELSVCITIYVH